MAVENYEAQKKSYDTGNDAVVIRQYLGGITGGRALDYSNFTDEVIRAGHIIVRKEIDGAYEYSPLETEGGKYKDKASDAEYAGVVVRSRMKGEAVAIMDNGRVNDIAMPYEFKDATQREAIKTALPCLVFEHD